MTRFEKKLPAWAVAVDNPDDKLCECGCLPYSVDATSSVAPQQRYVASYIMRICRACLLEEMASRGEIAPRDAIEFTSALRPPPATDYPAFWRKIDVQNLIDGTAWRHLSEWDDLGWLTGWERAGRTVVVSHEQIIAFLRNPAHWIAWRPEAIVDEPLRRWNAACRDAWPWSWVTAYEAAEQLGYTYHGAWKLCRTGAMRAVQYQQRWFIRSDEVERFRRDVLPTRKPGYDPFYGENMEKQNCYMPGAYIDGIRAFGNGSFSVGLRRLWEEKLARDENATKRKAG